MKMTLLILILSTTQLAHADQLFIESSGGDIYRSYRYSGGPTPDYKEKARLAACLTELRSTVEIDFLNQFFAFAVSERAPQLSEMLNHQIRTIVANGHSLHQDDIPGRQTILKWLATLHTSQNRSESRAVFMNFFNPDTVGSSCYNALSDYSAIRRLPSYMIQPVK